MNIIVAVYGDWGIGCHGTQPIVIPEDRRFFQEITMGATVISGRATFEDFPGKKPLKGRKNIILTGDKSFSVPGAVVVNSIGELFCAVENEDPEKIFVLGGEIVFRQLLPYCRYAYVTKIKVTPESDTFFPNLDELPNWVVKNEGQEHFNGHPFAFYKYENISPEKFTCEE
jgi:dihydrofolate reductase